MRGTSILRNQVSISLLASFRCPGNVIVHGLDVAIALREAPISIASGFQSPLEAESLKLLLKGSARLIVCPARSAIGMRIPVAWKVAIAAHRLSIRSAIDEGGDSDHQATQRSSAPRRPTAALAEQRNRFVAAISDAVLILHASPGGKLNRLATDLLAEGHKPVWTLDDPANAHLLARGCRTVRPDTVAVIWERA